MVHFSLLARCVRGAAHALARPLAALGLLLATAGAAQAQVDTPILVANQVSNITATSAEQGGMLINSSPGSKSGTCGVVYVVGTGTPVVGNGNGSFTFYNLTDGQRDGFLLYLSNLLPGTTYTERVYVRDNSSGVVTYSVSQVFTTPATPAPTLTSLSPTSGPVGASITLTGTNLTGATGVSFNGTAATTFISVNSTTVTATVPAGATSGNVTVTTSSSTSGGTSNGTSNGVAFVVNPPTNNALAFDGTNDYVALPASTPVPVGNTSYTIEAWIKPTAMGDYGIIGWGNYGTTNQVNALRLSSTGLINYWWANDLSRPTANLTGAWHHVASTFDGTTRTLYLDGVAVGSDAPGTGHAVPNANNLRIGSTNVSTPGNSGSGEYFPGSIDEVRVYNTGLTQAQIQADMFSTTSALPASQVAYYNFDQGTAGGNNAGLTSLPNLASTANPGTLTNFALTGTSSNWVRSFPTITGISPTGGSVGTNVTITGTNLTDATGFAFNGTPVASFGTPVSDLTTTVPVPNGATTGPVSVSSATLTRYNGPTFTVATALTWTGATSTDWATAGNWSPAVVPTTSIDVTIPAAPTNQPVVSGSQVSRNITVAASARLTLAANATLTVGSVGSGTSSSLLLGSGSTFAQGAGSEIYLTGNFTNNGATFALNPLSEIGFGIAPGTTHLLNGTAGLTVQTLSVGEQGSNDALIIQVPVQVRRMLEVFNNGTASAGTGGSLTLLSDASGTALIVNNNGGVVNGAVTVQRYIATTNAGLGYRHFGAPVSGATVASLSAGTSFTPILTQAYNTSATPATVTPFPNVFGYDQSRLASATNNLSAFDKGFVVPAATTTALANGTGYAVNIAAGQTVSFIGTPFTGDLTKTLSRGTDANAGWALLANPYPAPLNYALMESVDRPGLDAAIYVVQSTGQYTGAYRSFVNGMPAGGGVIASSQGFFTRVSQGQTSGSLTFRDAQRLTSYATQPVFQRSTADVRPQVQLDLAGTGGADAFIAYAEAGATAAFDSQYDAAKLPNSTGLNLASVAAGESLAIDGRAAFTTTTVLPLTVGVPTAGTYTLTAASLANLPAGLDAYLRDAATGQTVKLNVGSSYSFSVTAAQAVATIAGRFTLQFTSGTALATAPSLNAAEVSIYPNPARERFTVLVPAVASASSVKAELLNTLGQVVRQQAAALPAAGATLTVETAGLSTGVYTLRLQAGASTIAKRVVLQ